MRYVNQEETMRLVEAFNARRADGARYSDLDLACALIEVLMSRVEALETAVARLEPVPASFEALSRARAIDERRAVEREPGPWQTFRDQRNNRWLVRRWSVDHQWDYLGNERFPMPGGYAFRTFESRRDAAQAIANTSLPGMKVVIRRHHTDL